MECIATYLNCSPEEKKKRKKKKRKEKRKKKQLTCCGRSTHGPRIDPTGFSSLWLDSYTSRTPDGSGFPT
jgi:hypothetical protein